MTDQLEPAESSHRDIQFLAERAAAPETLSGSVANLNEDKGEAIMVLLTALSSSARFNQHHDRERAEMLASIRR
jgi:hypothetical protein